MRKRRGISTVVGMTLVILLLVVFFGSVYMTSISYQNYLEDVDSKINYLLEKKGEDLEYISITLKNNLTLQINVRNKGEQSIELVSLWMNSTYISMNNTKILPGETLSIDTGIIPTSNESYIIKLISARGNIFVTSWPFLVHIGVGNTSIPGGVGGIDIFADVKPDKIEKIGNITLKNIGPVAFKVNWLTTLIIIDINTGEIYSDHLDVVNSTWPTKGDKWPSKDKIDWDKNEFDSYWISPGEIFRLGFKFDDSNKPPPSIYDIYLHLHGYDQWGNLYIQALYLGRYELTE